MSGIVGVNDLRIKTSFSNAEKLVYLNIWKYNIHNAFSMYGRPQHRNTHDAKNNFLTHSS